jgi:acetyl-CoA C-acetyltransferase
MQAFPYTRLHCASWNVDQAGALLLCSAERATQLGIPRTQWIHAVASTESNHMVPVSARAELAACPGARIAGAAALQAGGLAATDVDLVEMYSCFPIAVEAYASELGLSLARDLTVTGGMPFAGGPFNNYVLQATCRSAELLRAGRGRTALVSSVSGILTKQGFGLWSTDPGPRAFRWQDLSRETARCSATREVVADYRGMATIAAYTVVHEPKAAPRMLVLADTATGARALAWSDDAAWLARTVSSELCGATISVDGAAFRPA